MADEDSSSNNNNTPNNEHDPRPGLEDGKSYPKILRLPTSYLQNFMRIRPRVSSRSRPISAIPVLSSSNSVLSPTPSFPTCMDLSEDESGQQQENHSLTKIPLFVAPTTSSHWTKMTWGEIKGECTDLINSVEQTMNDTLLTARVYADLQDKKRSLQTAMRRRNRIPDEVWLCFRTLQRTHEDVLNGNHSLTREQRRAQSAVSVFGSPIPSIPSISLNEAVQARARIQSQHDVGGRAGASSSLVLPAAAVPVVIPVPSRPRVSAVSFDGDVPPTLEGERDSSCLDILSSTLIRCGIELELYDEETHGLNRIAGVGLGIAVFVAICTVVYYF